MDIATIDIRCFGLGKIKGGVKSSFCFFAYFFHSYRAKTEKLTS